MTEGAAPVLMSRPPPVLWEIGWLSQYLEVVLRHIRGMITSSCLARNRNTYVCHSGGRWSYGCRCSISLCLPWAAMAAWAVFHSWQRAPTPNKSLLASSFWRTCSNLSRLEPAKHRQDLFTFEAVTQSYLILLPFFPGCWPFWHG